jgi:hypothetical protein
MWLTLHAMTLNSALEPIWDRYLPYIKNPVKADNPFDNYIPALVDDELSAYVGCWGERGAAAR